MSPEQARGQAVDPRTDIWAFGCVVYEMLTARPAFPGSTIPDVLAGVLAREPDWSQLPTGVPPAVQHLLARCLEKDPSPCLDNIANARFALDDSDRPVARQGRVSRRRLGIPALGALLVVVAGASLYQWPRQGAEGPDSQRAAWRSSGVARWPARPTTTSRWASPRTSSFESARSAS
jgi:serine/threonine protein kinase